MFKSFVLATALVGVEAWERRYVRDDYAAPRAYGVDNQHYGHQQGHGDLSHGGKNGRGFQGRIDAHNSHRQSGHQGQGHNQWVDNAWNQWGTNNHWDTQKAVDNKWGNNSGKINVTLNSVSGHYDSDYGQQQRGIGYEGHQNTSGDVGYVIGLAGHSFGYAPGNHSFGYENDTDYGYGGWANNLGAWNHGANYDNFGNQHHDDHTRGVANEARDSADVKRVRRVGPGYADLEELEDTDRRDKGDQYGRGRVAALQDLRRGTGHFEDDRRVNRSNRGFGIDVNGPRQRNYARGSYGGTDQGFGLGGGNKGGLRGLGGFGRGFGDFGFGGKGHHSGYGHRDSYAPARSSHGHRDSYAPARRSYGW